MLLDKTPTHVHLLSYCDRYSQNLTSKQLFAIYKYMVQESGYEGGYKQVQINQSEQETQQKHSSSTPFLRSEWGQQTKQNVSEVRAIYREGQGGVVESTSRFGEAILYQDFEFDTSGELVRVTVEKRLLKGIDKILPRRIGYAANKNYEKGNPDIPPAMRMVLVKDNEAENFRVQEKKSSSAELEKWQHAFRQHVGARQAPQPK